MDRSDTKHEQELALKLWVVLARAHNAVVEHVRQDLGRHRLSLAEFGVLEALFHKGPLVLGDVQRKILVSSGGITYLVDRLEERGLVVRRACPEDRRATYAVLTEEGEGLIGRIFPEHARRIEQALSGLDAGEKAAAIDLMRKLGLTAAALEPLGADGGK